VRAFLAIPLPLRLTTELAAVGAGLKGLRAQRAETIHLTVRFLGDIDEPAPIVDAVAPIVARTAPFELELTGLGVFPRPQRATVLWAGLARGADEAAALAAEVQAALVPLGFAPEKRPFVPHVTVGRFKRPQRFEPDEERSFGRARADRLVLYESSLTPQGARHQSVADLSLGSGM
jgi:2'-5' RNA ligase